MSDFLIGGFVAIGFYVSMFIYEWFCGPADRPHLDANVVCKTTRPSRAFQVTLFALLVIVVLVIVACVTVAALL
jgi:hypothetical protein